MRYRLTKARCLDGRRCQRLLWWRAHDRPTPPPTAIPALAAAAERGRRVCEKAREHVPGGVLIDFPPYMEALRLSATAVALNRAPPAIYEACFLEDGIFVEVDILERAAGAFRLLEVKSTTEVLERHLFELALELHVLRRAKVHIASAEVMHLDASCRYPDLSSLFRRVDVTAKVEKLAEELPSELDAMRSMLEGGLPSPSLGPSCHSPSTCPFIERCHGPTPPGSQPSPVEERRLPALALPLVTLVTKTIALPLPRWPGCRPYQAVPVQVSCHLSLGQHRAYLAGENGDPRPKVADELLAACLDAKTVVVWEADVERARLRELSEAIPELAPKLSELASRVFDLKGATGYLELAKAAAALVPEETYQGLEIREEDAAVLALERLWLDTELSQQHRTALRRELSAFCAMESRVMASIFERLRSVPPAC